MEGKELLYARQKIVLNAKAFQLQAIDMVHIDFKDLEGIYERTGSLCLSIDVRKGTSGTSAGRKSQLISPFPTGLREQSKAGDMMGFTGKQVIHPGQVLIVEFRRDLRRRLHWSVHNLINVNPLRVQILPPSTGVDRDSGGESGQRAPAGSDNLSLCLS